MKPAAETLKIQRPSNATIAHAQDPRELRPGCSGRERGGFVFGGGIIVPEEPQKVDSGAKVNNNLGEVK